MTVKELIEHLQTLDQDKGIWVCYDSFFWFPPIPDKETADLIDEHNYGAKGVKCGDYVIFAG